LCDLNRFLNINNLSGPSRDEVVDREYSKKFQNTNAQNVDTEDAAVKSKNTNDLPDAINATFRSETTNNLADEINGN
jgi:hypothetical protein